MGKRSRKRTAGPLRAESARPAAAPVTRDTDRRVARPKSRVDRMLERADERPKPPWHPVPLVEASVLIGIVLLVVGFLNADAARGRLAIAVGLSLASLAGLDTAAREHFTGYRSHSTLLGALPGVLTVAVLAVLHAPWLVGVLAGAAVFAGGSALARRAFRRRAGVGYKR